MNEEKIEPTDIRPIEFTILILLLVIGVPFNIYDVLVEKSEYPITSLIISSIFIALAAGLWLRNEFARRVLVDFTGLLVGPVIIMLLFIVSAVTNGNMPVSETIPLVFTLLTLCVLFLYLRSDRLLRYYWANDIRNNA